MQKTGLIVGKFYPFHQGHLNMILAAKMQVDTLHIFVCSETVRDHELFLESAFTKTPTSEDRVHWAKSLLANLPNTYIHDFNEDGIPSYPNGWEAWSNRLKETLKAKEITPTLIFSSEPQDQSFYETHFSTKVQLVDPPRNAFPVSATKIRTNPFQYWGFIPTVIRPFFTKHILIESAQTDNYSDDLLFQSIAKLYNAVEIPHYAKIEFHAITQENISPLLNKLKDERIMISAIIGSKSLIAEYQKNNSSHLPHKAEIKTLVMNTHTDNEIEKIEKFQTTQDFINQILRGE